jgi:hypothetical protein
MLFFISLFALIFFPDIDHILKIVRTYLVELASHVKEKLVQITFDSKLIIM